MTWKSICREAPVAVGIDPEHPALMRIRMRLNAKPPAEWAGFFARPVGVTIALGRRAPVLDGDVVWIQAPDDRFEEYVRDVDARIAGANARYEREVLPRLAANDREKFDAADAERERIRRANERLAGM